MSNRPPYVQAIESERDELAAELAAMRQREHDLVVYLCSSKFTIDTTVQAVDVLRRLGYR